MELQLRTLTWEQFMAVDGNAASVHALNDRDKAAIANAPGKVPPVRLDPDTNQFLGLGAALAAYEYHRRNPDKEILCAVLLK